MQYRQRSEGIPLEEVSDGLRTALLMSPEIHGERVAEGVKNGVQHTAILK